MFPSPWLVHQVHFQCRCRVILHFGGRVSFGGIDSDSFDYQLERTTIAFEATRLFFFSEMESSFFLSKTKKKEKMGLNFLVLPGSFCASCLMAEAHLHNSRRAAGKLTFFICFLFLGFVPDFSYLRGFSFHSCLIHSDFLFNTNNRVSLSDGFFCFVQQDWLHDFT